MKKSSLFVVIKSFKIVATRSKIYFPKNLSMSEEIIRSVLVKAGFKTFFVFLVVTTLDYFVDESDLLDQVNDFGFKIWILIFIFFCISSFIQLKAKKN